MRPDALDEALTRALRDTFQLSRRQEDAMWQQFGERCQRETAAWAAFAGIIAAFSVSLRPAVRAFSWPATLSIDRQEENR
jgi:hypothetical protein